MELKAILQQAGHLLMILWLGHHRVGSQLIKKNPGNTQVGAQFEPQLASQTTQDLSHTLMLLSDTYSGGQAKSSDNISHFAGY